MTTTEAADAVAAPARSRGIQIARNIGWVVAFIGFLTLFTVAKLPDDRIGGLLLGKASEVLSSDGRRVELSAERTRISLLLLGRIRFEGLTVRTSSSSGAPASIRWDEARLSPSLLDLFLARLGGTVQLLAKDGSSLSLAFWSSRGGKFSLSAKFDKAELGNAGLGIVPILSGIDATLPLTGTIDLSGDTHQPTSMAGKIQLGIGKTELPAQRISGFPLPAIRFGDGEIRANVAQGTIKIESLRLGKMDRETDDLRGSASGDIALSRSWDSSQLNLKARLRFSEPILKSLFLLDALLGPGKQPDGSYSIQLTGPLYAPQMQPGGASP
jgi:type II secretion system protein N